MRCEASGWAGHHVIIALNEWWGCRWFHTLQSTLCLRLSNVGLHAQACANSVCGFRNLSCRVRFDLKGQEIVRVTAPPFSGYNARLPPRTQGRAIREIRDGQMGTPRTVRHVWLAGLCRETCMYHGCSVSDRSHVFIYYVILLDYDGSIICHDFMNNQTLSLKWYYFLKIFT